VFEEFLIKERSFIARIAAKKMQCRQVAIVIGKTIHLHNTSKKEFISNARWVRHEMVHIDQFRRYGNLNFALMYIIESIRKGYLNNRFEVEARLAEFNEPIRPHQTGISVP
jgi:hypothetical protein